MTKAQLRNHYKACRKALSEAEIDNYSLAIANQILQLPIWEFNYFNIFLPIASQYEVNTEYILNVLYGKDKTIAVPKTNFSTKTMTHYLLTDSTKLKLNAYQIPEPVDGIEVPSNRFEVVFVPLLAYDSFGNRVGYGKGFYDKFLSQCQPKTIKIGLSFFEPEQHIDDVSKTDVKLDFCVTPNHVYTFKT